MLALFMLNVPVLAAFSPATSGRVVHYESKIPRPPSSCSKITLASSRSSCSDCGGRLRIVRGARLEERLSKRGALLLPSCRRSSAGGTAPSYPTPAGSAPRATATATLVQREMEVRVRPHRLAHVGQRRARRRTGRVARAASAFASVNRSAARRTASDSSASRTGTGRAAPRRRIEDTRALVRHVLAEPERLQRTHRLANRRDRHAERPGSSSSRSGVPAGSSPMMIASHSCSSAYSAIVRCRIGPWGARPCHLRRPSHNP